MIKKLLKIAAALLFCFQMLLNLNVARAGNDDDPMEFRLYQVNGNCKKLRVSPKVKISMLDRLFGGNTEYICSGRVLEKDSDFAALENSTNIVAVPASCRELVPSWLKFTKLQDFSGIIERAMTTIRKIKANEKARLADMHYIRIEGSRKASRRVRRKAMYSSQEVRLEGFYLSPPTVIPSEPEDVSTTPLPILW